MFGWNALKSRGQMHQIPRFIILGDAVEARTIRASGRSSSGRKSAALRSTQRAGTRLRTWRGAASISTLEAERTADTKNNHKAYRLTCALSFKIQNDKLRYATSNIKLGKSRSMSCATRAAAVLCCTDETKIRETKNSLLPAVSRSGSAILENFQKCGRYSKR